MTVGETFHWSWLDSSGKGTAVVLGFRSDQELGMASEVDQYAARWMDARALAGDSEGESLMFMLGTDNRVYLNGHEVSLTTHGSADAV